MKGRRKIEPKLLDAEGKPVPTAYRPYLVYSDTTWIDDWAVQDGVWIRNERGHIAEEISTVPANGKLSHHHYCRMPAKKGDPVPRKDRLCSAAIRCYGRSVDECRRYRTMAEMSCLMEAELSSETLDNLMTAYRSYLVMSGEDYESGDMNLDMNLAKFSMPLITPGP